MLYCVYLIYASCRKNIRSEVGISRLRARQGGFPIAPLTPSDTKLPDRHTSARQWESILICTNSPSADCKSKIGEPLRGG